MNDFYNHYTYNLYKILLNLNLLDDIDFNIPEEDLPILKVFHDQIDIFNNVDYDTYINIIKKLSFEFMRTPIQIVDILYKNQINKNG